MLKREGCTVSGIQRQVGQEPDKEPAPELMDEKEPKGKNCASGKGGNQYCPEEVGI